MKEDFKEYIKKQLSLIERGKKRTVNGEAYSYTYYTIHKGAIDKFCEFIDTQKSIDKNTWVRFSEYCINKHEIAPKTINNYRGVIKLLAIDYGIKPGILRYWRQRKYQKNVKRYLTMEEVDMFKDEVLLKKYADMFRFACYTGLRHSDLSTITKDKIFNGRIALSQQKTSKMVSIKLHKEAIKILEENNYGEDFPKVTTGYYNRKIKEIAKRVGIENYEEITSHTARRTLATNMYLNGAPLSLIQTFTGHETDTMLRTYILQSGVSDREQEKINDYL